MNEVWKVLTEDELLEAFRHSYEYLQKHIMLACSHIKQTQVQNTVTILDMTGFGMGMMRPAVYDLLKKGSKVMQDNYPETLG